MQNDKAKLKTEFKNRLYALFEKPAETSAGLLFLALGVPV